MSAEPPISASTLRQALAFFLEDDNYIDRLEAEGLAALIQRDGKVSSEEKAFLENALAQANFDAQALAILKKVLDEA